ncbi:MAG: cellulase family glycosylhydrolase [Fibrobacterales bacterium]
MKRFTILVATIASFFAGCTSNEPLLPIPDEIQVTSSTGGQLSSPTQTLSSIQSTLSSSPSNNQSSTQTIKTSSSSKQTIGHESSSNTLVVVSSSHVNQPSSSLEELSSTVSSSQSTPTLSYLTTKGTVIVNAKGDTVALRGINIGGWLVTENWMNGFTDASDTQTDRFTLETLEERFGEDKADTLLEVWRSNFFTETDLDHIQESGMNLIRVPFGYRNLQNRDGSWKMTLSGNIDFGWMDWIVTKAEERGLYVLFDYHIWKGQEEGKTDKIGDEGTDIFNNAYRYISCGDEGEKRDAQNNHAIEVLTKVIEHYKGRGAIAAIELINEACGGTWASIPLYDGVREIDPDRILMAWGDPMPQTADWYNVIYGHHLYTINGSNFDDNKTGIDEHINEMLAMQQTYDVPYYTGEYHIDHEDSHRYLLEQYAKHNISWSKWTYKGVNIGNWACMVLPNTVDIDVLNDSYETIVNTWSTLSSSNPWSNESVQSVLKYGAGL